jgi:heat shock protein HtpX
MENSEKTISFEIRTEVTEAYFGDLLTFIYQNYILPLHLHFTNIRQWSVDKKKTLAFTFLDTQGRWHIDVEIEAEKVVKVRMKPSLTVPKSVLDRLKEDLIINIQFFEERIRGNTLYFAFVESSKIMLERPPEKRKKVLGQIFRGNMLFFFMIFILISIAVFQVFREYAPIVLVLSQFVIVLFADKILMRMGQWSMTPDNPYVHILQYHIPREDLSTFRERYDRDLLLRIKREIYKETLAVGRPIDYETAERIFSRYGITCRPENLSTKMINVYDIVREAAERFNIPVPKIRIANIILPNAGATGPTLSRSLVLITSGLLVQLEEDEIFSVVGHEISHLKGRDPLVLFAITSAEYLFRVYLLPPYVFYFFGFFYFFLILSGIYFVAKFFEARADLESAIRIGRPKVLAGALRKIGYRKIQMERLRYSRIGNWLGIDPHPPISFRVNRLENLEDPSIIRHTFLRSMVDCIKGLIGS